MLEFSAVLPAPSPYRNSVLIGEGAWAWELPEIQTLGFVDILPICNDSALLTISRYISRE